MIWMIRKDDKKQCISCVRFYFTQFLLPINKSVEPVNLSETDLRIFWFWFSSAQSFFSLRSCSFFNSNIAFTVDLCCIKRCKYKLTSLSSLRYRYRFIVHFNAVTGIVLNACLYFIFFFFFQLCLRLCACVCMSIIMCVKFTSCLCPRVSRTLFNLPQLNYCSIAWKEHNNAAT